MGEEYRDKTLQDLQQSMNGTEGDMPTGYRPCPFCHSVIPWESERCPSCGRVFQTAYFAKNVGFQALEFCFVLTRKIGNVFSLRTQVSGTFRIWRSGAINLPVHVSPTSM
jgi:hypothetical protein